MIMEKLFVLGDSISIHYGNYLKQCLKGKIKYERKGDIAKAEENLDIPKGANGGDSSHVLTYLSACVFSGEIDADFLLLNCGLHDIKRSSASNELQISLEEYKINLLKIIDIVAKIKLQLIWVTTTPVNDKIHNSISISFSRYSEDCKNYNKVAEKIMSNANIPIIDLYSFTENMNEELFCDHVHFHESIKKKQAEFIADWLNEYMIRKRIQK